MAGLFPEAIASGNGEAPRGPVLLARSMVVDVNGVRDQAPIASSTASAWPGTFTLRQIAAILPSASTR